MGGARAAWCGYSRVLKPVLGTASGKNRYLIKPFGLEEILTHIRAMIGEA
jgi:DNA-binding response OmpR family regulator